ncbi:MAG: SUMF1/EgtB/PvdO family nonheme iron enzyme [Bacteroidia bacterium]
MKTTINTQTTVSVEREGNKLNRISVSLCTLFLSILFSNSLIANNLVIGAPTVAVGPGTISFTIQWDNSWNVASGPTNWDGVWVFVKRQACADMLWNHALLSTNAADHNITGGVLQVDAVTDGMGVFIRRSSAGIGNIPSSTVTLKLQTAPNLVDNFKVFGIEVVNVPQGNFYIGDGTRGSSTYGFSAANPYPSILITNVIQTAGIGAAANYQVNGWGSTGALPASFPLGWNKFYCMKYEISQDQYTSFLNTLNYDQQVARTANPPNGAVGTLAIAGATPSRNDIRISTSGTINNIPAIYTTTLPNLACNWLSWADLTAYLDWSALRPMTEFEFEKVCRGTAAAAASENAWGTTDLLQAESGALNNAGLVNETSTAAGAGLCAYGINNTAKGPLRCGFAATAATTRVQSGGSYYGAMDLSGNVDEQCLGGYNYNYSTFTNINGDGSLSSVGTANTANWPSLGGGQNGGIMRGSNWFTPTVSDLNVSDRGLMTQNYNNNRDYRVGGRGVRSW